MTSEIIFSFAVSIFGLAMWWFFRKFEGGGMTGRVRALCWLCFILGVPMFFMTLWRLIRGE